MTLMTCKNAAFSYDGKTVVQDVNFLVESGQYLCIVGENGSGKSTLIKGLLGLLSPEQGEIIYHDLKRSDIGYLPQQTAVQRDFPASVYEVVLSGCLSGLGTLPFFRRADHERAEKAMKRLRITDLKKACYRELSGGQQQRVLLARALCSTRKLLLLDEPISGLDPMATADLYEQIHRLNREDGITVVMVSHDIAAAVAYATHILHLKQSPLFFGTKEDYVASAAGQLFLGGDAT